MVMPCATISSRMSGHRRHPGCWRRRRIRRPPASGRESCSRRTGRRQIAGRRRSTYGARCSAGWRQACRRRPAASAADAITRPRHDDMLRRLPGPFDIGDGDLAVDAVLDRLDDTLVGQRCGIALALDLQLDGRHGKRDIDGQDQFDVDRFGGRKPAWRPRGRGRSSSSCQPPPQESRNNHPMRIDAKCGGIKAGRRDKGGLALSLFRERGPSCPPPCGEGGP